jgi:hypothetical protein
MFHGTLSNRIVGREEWFLEWFLINLLAHLAAALANLKIQKQNARLFASQRREVFLDEQLKKSGLWENSSILPYHKSSFFIKALLYFLL